MSHPGSPVARRLTVAGAILVCASGLAASISPRREFGPEKSEAAELAAAPAIVAVTPSRAALAVWRNAPVEVQFDQAMDPSSLSSQTLVVTGEASGRHLGTVAYSDLGGIFFATFTAAVPFALGERVVATVTNGARAADLVPLGAAYSWSFTIETEAGEIGFTLDSTYSAARLPFELCSGDMNEDEFIDFAVIHTPATAGTLAVFTSRADGSLKFDLTTRVRTTVGPRGIASADFDGDLFADVAITTSLDSGFVVFPNDQTGQFADTAHYDANLLAYNIHAADVDGDADVDLAMGNLQGNQILLARNNGAGSFGAFSTLAADSSPRNIELYDLDADGDRELIAVNANGRVSVFDNLGGGAFAPDVVYPVGLRSLSLCVNDLNGDGQLDAAVSNVQGGSISILLNDGEGGFAPQYTVVVDSINVGPGKNTLFDVYGSDFDGDGDIDLATANWYIGRLFVLENDGAGGFEVAFESDSLGVGLQNVTGGDFDGDGDVDLVVTDWVSGKLRVLGNGPAAFGLASQTPAPYAAAGSATQPMSVRFTARADASTLSPGTVFVSTDLSGQRPVALNYVEADRTLYVSADAPFRAGERIEALLGPGIVSSTGAPLAPFLWRWTTATLQGSATFQEISQTAVASVAQRVIPAFIDGDDLLDFFLFSTLGGTLTVHTNQGGGSFAAGGPIALGIGAVAAVAGDWDGDGAMDVAVANATLATVSTFRTVGLDSLVATGSVNLAGIPVELAAGDFDLNGETDIVALTKNPSRAQIWSNFGGALSATALIPLGANPRDVAPIDNDLDGDLDLAVLRASTGVVNLLRNDRQGGFTLQTTVTGLGLDPLDLETADLSGDGLPDLAVALGGSSNVVVVPSAGPAGFGPPALIPMSIASVDISLADMNGDAVSDIVAVSPDDQELTLLFGQGGGAFGADSVYQLSHLPSTVVAGDFLGLGRLDLIVGAANAPSLMLLANDPATDVPPPIDLPAARLRAVTPNPARGPVVARFDLPQDGSATLDVFDIQGRLVRRLLRGPQAAGMTAVEWDGRDAGGRPVGSGVYFFRLRSGGTSATAKAVLVR